MMNQFLALSIYLGVFFTVLTPQKHVIICLSKIMSRIDIISVHILVVYWQENVTLFLTWQFTHKFACFLGTVYTVPTSLGVTATLIE